MGINPMQKIYIAPHIVHCKLFFRQTLGLRSLHLDRERALDQSTNESVARSSLS